MDSYGLHLGDRPRVMRRRLRPRRVAPGDATGPAKFGGSAVVEEGERDGTASIGRARLHPKWLKWGRSNATG